MPLSFKNFIPPNPSSLMDGTKTVKKIAKYIKGYANQSAIEALANSLNLDTPLFKQAFGIEDTELDLYDPYHISDAKAEEFWSTKDVKQDGKAVQKTNDEDTNTFKRGLYSNKELGGYAQNDIFWYEDPFIPKFELFFSTDSPLFSTSNTPNSLKYFMNTYSQIDAKNYQSRGKIWNEFINIFFKIFNKDMKSERDPLNKVYYITKIGGLNNLNKKFIKYGPPDGDKITITINEDVSMIAWYISELYNNLIYSYKNQRYMFPENLLRFDLNIRISELRNFQVPQSNNPSGANTPTNPNYLQNQEIKYIMSPQSEIVYTLHDCNFNFFESKNYDDDMEIGGFSSPSYAAKNLTFDIYFKSVTRYSEYPLISNSIDITPWGDKLYDDTDVTNSIGTHKDYYDNLSRASQTSAANITTPSFLNSLLGKAQQTIANQSSNYLSNLETKFREVRGSAVNSLLNQFSKVSGFNKIEPDNVYASNFNNRISVNNLVKQVGSGLLNNLEDSVRNGANF